MGSGQTMTSLNFNCFKTMLVQYKFLIISIFTYFFVSFTYKVYSRGDENILKKTIPQKRTGPSIRCLVASSIRCIIIFFTFTRLAEGTWEPRVKTLLFFYIKALPFPTFCQILEALRVEWRIYNVINFNQ